MSFLKKLGSIALAVGKAAPVAGPILAAIVPGQKDDAIIAKATGTIDQLAAIVANVEVMGQALSLAGTQKLTAATPLIAQMIAQSSIVMGHGIADETLFKSGCEKVASGLADVLNSLKDDKIA